MLITVLPAYNGDCILIRTECSDTSIITNILVDGGIARTYPQVLKKQILAIQDRGEFIDLLVLTHIDEDHIGGILKLFEDTTIDKSIIKKVLFNSGEIISNYFKTIVDSQREQKIILSDSKKLSINDGITFEHELKKYNLFQDSIIKSLDKLFVGHINITVLSPDLKNLKRLNNKWEIEVNKGKKASDNDIRNYNIPLKKLQRSKFTKDNSIPNGSSIAMLLEYKDKKILLLGDSYSSVVTNSLKDLGYNSENPIKVDFVKISHHGSSKNTSYDFLNVVKSNNYILSTDGENHNLPNKEVFARILKINNNSVFYFNYDNKTLRSIFSKDDAEDFSFKSIYLSNQNYEINI